MTSISARPQTTDILESNLDVIRRLQGRIDEALGPLVPALQAKPYALLDFPDYGNIGDSAIWQGNIAWLKRRVLAAPVYTCRCYVDLAEMKAKMPDGVILLQGGGNFGDIWPQHQSFRDAVLDAFPGRPVVQLPQSIHYGDEAAVARTAEAIRRHGAFTLLVRDQPSYDLATSRFDCTVTLCPDMAFALGPLQRSRPPVSDVLLALREDIEARPSSAVTDMLPKAWVRSDWPADDPALYAQVLRQTRLSSFLTLDSRKWRREARTLLNFNTLADRRVASGLHQLSGARFIITDRLHVHILSTLLGVPHVFLDNSYGKIRRFSDCFGTTWDGAAPAESMEEAIAVARSFLASSGPVAL